MVTTRLVSWRRTKENEEEEMEEEETEEVSSKELMNQPNTSEEKLMHKSARGSNYGDTSSMESEPLFVGTPASRVRINDDDDFWM
jgi:hypothetical protein